MKAPGLPWVSSGPEGPVVMPLLPMQEVPLQRLVIESLSCILCSTGKI